MKMPFLGKKIYDPGNVEISEGSNVYEIPFTLEKFNSEEEYNRKLDFYNMNIWTCQCTGHHNFTYQEAMSSEKKCRERLAQSYGQPWEEPLLKLVQHSYSTLDSMVNEAHHIFMTTFVVDEKVVFTAKQGKTFDATIVKMYKLPETENDEKLNGSISDDQKVKAVNCTTSPSSDKENKTRQTLITEVFKPDMRRSSRTISPKTETLSKGKKPSLILAKYDILLTNENKIVSKVPLEHLQRSNKVPSRELIRWFLRANAFKPASQGKKKLPWIVDENMAFRYSLPRHFSVNEEKEMLSRSTITQEKYMKGNSSKPFDNGNNGMPPETDDQIVDLENIANTSDLVKSCHIKLSPIFGKKRKISDSTPTISKRQKNDKKSVKKINVMDDYLKMKNTSMNSRNVASLHNDHSSIVINELSSPKKKLFQDAETPLKTDNHTILPVKSSRKNSSPKKKKQLTLLELTKKGSRTLLASRTPTNKSRSSLTPRKPRQPIIVTHLMSLKKDKNRAHKYQTVIARACQVLTEKQRSNLPVLIKDDVIRNYNRREVRKMLKGMTEEQKKERRLMKRRENKDGANKKFEDQDFMRNIKHAKVLPSIELVSLPEGLPNTSFGDVAMLCEFLHAYHRLLHPKDPFFHRQFNVNIIIEAVLAGKNGFSVTSRILVVLLQTLLSDTIAKDYTEMEYNLNQIYVTPEVACELVRICLRQHDEDIDDETSDTSSNSEVVITGLPDMVSKHLYEVELYDMEPDEQILVMSTLAYRVMNTYAVQMYMTNTHEKAMIALREKKEIAKENKEAQLLKKEEPSVKVQEERKKEEEEACDLVSRVKQRKVLTEKHRREEAEKKAKRREEEEERRKLMEVERSNREMNESRQLARNVIRTYPLGTDRHHNRYWLFCDGAPGLYIEKGWVNDYIEYTTSSVIDKTFPFSPQKSPVKVEVKPVQTNVDISSSEEDNIPLAQLRTPKKPTFKKSEVENTMPRDGQNLWSVIDTQEDLDQLIESLFLNGLRESKLRTTLQSKYNSILRSINKRKALSQSQSSLTHQKLNGEEIFRNKARKQLLTLINEAHRGRIMNVEDPLIFQQRVESAKEPSAFCAVLLDVEKAIPSQFLKQYMSNGIKVVNPEGTVEKNAKIGAAARRLGKWRQAVEDTTLFSRFFLLFAMLNNNIKWELYSYKRSLRGLRSRNYAEMKNPGNKNEDEEEQEEEDMEEEEEEYMEEVGRRSSRLREKKTVKYQKYDETELVDGASEKSKEKKSKPKTNQTRSSRRTSRKNYSLLSKEEEDEEDEEEEDDDSEQSEEEEEVDETDICRNIVEKLMKYKYTEIFRDPVDEEEVPDYYEIVSDPLCLTEILNRIEGVNVSSDRGTRRSNRSKHARKYECNDIMRDMRLLLDNVALYNQDDSYACNQAIKLEQAFVRLCKEVFCEPAHHKKLRTLFRR